jgi:putative SOS response-associated peptidase YedK
VFAGLWDLWADGKTKLMSCCSITTAANDLMAPIHNRMPVIVAPEDDTDWLAVDTPLAG